MNRQEKPESKGTEKNKSEKNRKPYVKPQLNRYGDMEKLTESTVGSGAELGKRKF